MLFGSPLRAAISRSGRASPDDRNADSSCEECTTDFTRYGSRAGRLASVSLTTDSLPRSYRKFTEADYVLTFRNAQYGFWCAKRPRSRSEVRGPRSEVRGRKPEARGPRPEVRRPNPEDRTPNREPRTANP